MVAAKRVTERVIFCFNPTEFEHVFVWRRYFYYLCDRSFFRRESVKPNLEVVGDDERTPRSSLSYLRPEPNHSFREENIFSGEFPTTSLRPSSPAKSHECGIG